MKCMASELEACSEFPECKVLHQQMVCNMQQLVAHVLTLVFHFDMDAVKIDRTVIQVQLHSCTCSQVGGQPLAL